MARWLYSFVCTLSYLTIITMQTYCKVLNFYYTCQIHSVECMSKIKSILSMILHAIYGAVCIQHTHSFYDDCENTCTLSYYHHWIGSMIHLPSFRNRPWNNGTRCMFYYIRMMELFWIRLCTITSLRLKKPGCIWSSVVFVMEESMRQCSPNIYSISLLPFLGTGCPIPDVDNLGMLFLFSTTSLGCFCPRILLFE